MVAGPPGSLHLVSTYLLFLLLGLGSGAVYGILALGLVLKYRSAGVVDFGHGAVAMFIAYVFLGLRDQGRSSCPGSVLPHKIQISSTGVSDGSGDRAVARLRGDPRPRPVRRSIYRPLRRRAPLTRVCASVGIDARAAGDRGAELRHARPKSTPTILPSEPLDLAGITVPVDRLWFAGIVVVLAAVLALVYRYTRFGLATRAAAENEQRRRADRPLGDPDRDAATGSSRRCSPALAGILIAPVSTRRPDLVHAVHRPGARASRWSRASSRSRSPRSPGSCSACASRRSPSC